MVLPAAKSAPSRLGDSRWPVARATMSASEIIPTTFSFCTTGKPETPRSASNPAASFSEVPGETVMTSFVMTSETFIASSGAF